MIWIAFVLIAVVIAGIAYAIGRIVGIRYAIKGFPTVFALFSDEQRAEFIRRARAEQGPE